MALVEVRNRVYTLTNRLQAVLSYIEEDQKARALLSISDCMAELSKITTLVANGLLQDSPAEKQA